MNYGEGLISKIYRWIWHPSNSDGTIEDWAAGLIVLIVLSYLWSTNVKMIAK